MGTKQEKRNQHLQQEIDRFNAYYKLGEHLSLKLDLVNEVFNTFENQGHSGFSANYCFRYLTQLMNTHEETMRKLNEMLSNDSEGLQTLITNNILEIYNLISAKPLCIQKAILDLLQDRPLTPLTGEEDEWVEDTFYAGEPYKRYSNKRCSNVSKYVMSDGIEICTYLYDRSFSDNGGCTFFTTGRFGRVQITFPFTPPEESEVVHIYAVEGIAPFILTDPKTIAQVRENYKKRRDEVDY